MAHDRLPQATTPLRQLLQTHPSQRPRAYMCRQLAAMQKLRERLRGDGEGRSGEERRGEERRGGRGGERRGEEERGEGRGGERASKRGGERESNLAESPARERDLSVFAFALGSKHLSAERDDCCVQTESQVLACMSQAVLASKSSGACLRRACLRVQAKKAG
jgi:hypothetical protein